MQDIRGQRERERERERERARQRLAVWDSGKGVCTIGTQLLLLLLVIGAATRVEQERGSKSKEARHNRVLKRARDQLSHGQSAKTSVLSTLVLKGPNKRNSVWW